METPPPPGPEPANIKDIEAQLKLDILDLFGDMTNTEQPTDESMVRIKELWDRRQSLPPPTPHPLLQNPQLLMEIENAVSSITNVDPNQHTPHVLQASAPAPSASQTPAATNPITPTTKPPQKRQRPSRAKNAGACPSKSAKVSSESTTTSSTSALPTVTTTTMPSLSSIVATTLNLPPTPTTSAVPINTGFQFKVPQQPNSPSLTQTEWTSNPDFQFKVPQQTIGQYQQQIATNQQQSSSSSQQQIQPAQPLIRPAQQPIHTIVKATSRPLEPKQTIPLIDPLELTRQLFDDVLGPIFDAGGDFPPRHVLRKRFYRILVNCFATLDFADCSDEMLPEQIGNECIIILAKAGLVKEN